MATGSKAFSLYRNAQSVSYLPLTLNRLTTSFLKAHVSKNLVVRVNLVLHKKKHIFETNVSDDLIYVF